MKALKELLTVVENNRELVVLEVKPNSKLDLIVNGFDGYEVMFRVTKGPDHTYTQWTDDGKHSSHDLVEVDTLLFQMVGEIKETK